MRGSGRRLRTLILVAAVGAGAAGAAPAWGATVTVSTTAQLEAAVTGAQNGDEIVLSAGTYQPSHTLEITKNITLRGPQSPVGRTSPGARIDGAYVTGSLIDVIEVAAGRTATIRNVTVTRTQRRAVGILVSGTLTLEGATLTGNADTAVWVAGTATIRNSTIANNAREGLEVDGTARLFSATVAQNGRNGIAGAGRAELTNTIVWGNGTALATPRDCSAPVEVASRSLDGDGSCDVDAGSTNPQLGPLATYGGTTQTRPILAGSPAIDSGTETGCPATDQRFAPRADGRCDIGAVEFGATAGDASAPVVTVPAPFTAPAVSAAGAAVAYSATAVDAEGPVASLTCSPASGAVFPVGPTLVNCTATDPAGNAWAEAFRLTVTGDGVACQADGKVAGRGSTFQAAAQAALIAGYRDDVCGSVPGGGVIAYNPAGALTGSAEGLRAAGCRTDPLGGTDIPFDSATLALLNGAPGAIGGCPSGHPAGADAQAALMAVPLGGSAVTLGVNLPASACAGPRPTALSLTAAMVDGLFDGSIATWSAPALRAGGVNSALATCATPVRRVVRADPAGTAQVLKAYLRRVDPTGPGCGSGATWTALAAAASNTTWPTGGGCTALITPAGDPAAVAACANPANAGAICFAGLADVVGAPALIRASVRNATDTAFAAPSVGPTRANCALGALTIPGGTATGAVGLDPADTWATDNGAGNRGDVTQQGAGYPICGLTFALVYAGLGDEAVANAVSWLNVHQRQTVRSYLGYVLSSAGQDRLNAARFASLPTPVATTVRSGFLARF